eukprot:7037081-Alexandrium_andersonii.AAC.1
MQLQRAAEAQPRRAPAPACRSRAFQSARARPARRARRAVGEALARIFVRRRRTASVKVPK